MEPPTQSLAYSSAFTLRVFTAECSVIFTRQIRCSTNPTGAVFVMLIRIPYSKATLKPLFRVMTTTEPLLLFFLELPRKLPTGLGPLIVASCLVLPVGNGWWVWIKIMEKKTFQQLKQLQHPALLGSNVSNIRRHESEDEEHHQNADGEEQQHEGWGRQWGQNYREDEQRSRQADQDEQGLYTEVTQREGNLNSFAINLKCLLLLFLLLLLYWEFANHQDGQEDQTLELTIIGTIPPLRRNKMWAEKCQFEAVDYLDIPDYHSKTRFYECTRRKCRMGSAGLMESLSEPKFCASLVASTSFLLSVLPEEISKAAGHEKWNLGCCKIEVNENGALRKPKKERYRHRGDLDSDISVGMRISGSHSQKGEIPIPLQEIRH
ncbi:hypothetical protein H6P81_011919 [Aristolochia fimbriata]|uniref:Uncharacterized protein n=1 Tax=Aristolochia fimbriata TaxID=158543 RepID=A0AAV7EBL3_ARIFI|nr:hypothetical protein H6P81_011919 [Aristolochia fimbriata]